MPNDNPDSTLDVIAPLAHEQDRERAELAAQTQQFFQDNQRAARTLRHPGDAPILVSWPEAPLPFGQPTDFGHPIANHVANIMFALGRARSQGLPGGTK